MGDTTPPLRLRSAWLLLLLPCLVYLGGRLLFLTSSCLDGDEIFSVEAARAGWGGLFRVAIDDISHPPLFYLLLRGWMTLGGDSLLWLRLLPVAISLLALLPLVGLCRTFRLGTAGTALVLLLAGANGFLIYFSQHVRMFALLYACSIASMHVLARMSDPERARPRDAQLLFFLNLLLVYSHYWGWLVVGTEFLYLLAIGRSQLGRSQLRAFILAGFGLVACYAPWVWAILSSAGDKGTATSQIAWIGRPAVSDFLWFFKTLGGIAPVPLGGTIALAALGLPALFWALRLRRADGEPRFFLFLALFALVPPILTFGLSHLLSQSVWAPRQLIVSAIPCMMLAAGGVLRSPSRLRPLLLALLTTWVLVAGWTTVEEEHKRIPWDQLFAGVTAAEPEVAGPIRFYAAEKFVRIPARFYFGETGEKRFEVEENEDPATYEGAHFWVAYRDTKWNKGVTPQTILEERGFRIGAVQQVGTRSQSIFAFPVSR